MISPQAVVFDLGKVLVDFDYAIAARTLAARSKLAHDQINGIINQTPLLLRYETGLMSRKEFYDLFCASTGFGGDIEEFADAFGNIFTPIEPMIEVHRALRQAGLRTYVFSNTNDMAIAHIRKNFPFFSQFDGYVLSYEHGAMKPDPKIYEVVEKMSQCASGEIFYLDDRPENILAGQQRGWQVLLQESPEKTRAALKQLGFPGI
jgi:FMN phosphatase YigB (HAD superfamily)